MDAPLQIQAIYNLVEEQTLLFAHQINHYHDETQAMLRRWDDARSVEFQKTHQSGLNEISYQATDILKRARLHLHTVQQAIRIGDEHLTQARMRMHSLEEVTGESLLLQQRATDFAERATMSIHNAQYSISDAEQLLGSLGTPPI
ncbi:hypothetical protein [Duffyella gerundensis]|uniref:hypothetical protein n=1 Tax=Duffyella gerundensis TaxID=1619313 RepID=UPI0021F72B6E|nr:hypothetical protein [Duffyella gerundensis]